MPARFRESSCEDDSDDGVVCAICDNKEPNGVCDQVIFWVDCDKCDKWVHNKCAFKKNLISRKYLCEKCKEHS